MKFIGNLLVNYWNTVEDEHIIWSDAILQKYSMCTPSISIFLVLFTPGSSMLKNNINPYSKTLIFFSYSNCSSSTVYNPMIFPSLFHYSINSIPCILRFLMIHPYTSLSLWLIVNHPSMTRPPCAPRRPSWGASTRNGWFKSFAAFIDGP